MQGHTGGWSTRAVDRALASHVRKTHPRQQPRASISSRDCKYENAPCTFCISDNRVSHLTRPSQLARSSRFSFCVRPQHLLSKRLWEATSPLRTPLGRLLHHVRGFGMRCSRKPGLQSCRAELTLPGVDITWVLHSRCRASGWLFNAAGAHSYYSSPEATSLSRQSSASSQLRSN